MYKQVLLLVGLVFLSTFVRSHPVKPAADKTADAASAPSAGDEAAGSNMVSPKLLDEAINAMNELNDKFEKIVQLISPESNGGDAGDADVAAADDANPAA